MALILLRQHVHTFTHFTHALMCSIRALMHSICVLTHDLMCSICTLIHSIRAFMCFICALHALYTHSTWTLHILPYIPLIHTHTLMHSTCTLIHSCALHVFSYIHFMLLLIHSRVIFTHSQFPHLHVSFTHSCLYFIKLTSSHIHTSVCPYHISTFTSIIHTHTSCQKTPSYANYHGNIWIDWTKLIADAIDIKIKYPITQLTNIYNPFKPWIIRSKHSPSTFKIGSITHLKIQSWKSSEK